MSDEPKPTLQSHDVVAYIRLNDCEKVVTIVYNVFGREHVEVIVSEVENASLQVNAKRMDTGEELIDIHAERGVEYWELRVEVSQRLGMNSSVAVGRKSQSLFKWCEALAKEAKFKNVLRPASRVTVVYKGA